MSEIIGRLGGNRDLELNASDAAAPADGFDAAWLRRHLAGAVVAATTTVPGGYRGATLTACTYVSGDPLLLLVSLERESQMDGWLETSGVFAVNILPWTEQFIADQFAGFAPRALSAFQGIDHMFAVTGCPILRRSIAWADCRVTRIVETGDHRCFIGEVLSLGSGDGVDGDPLIYYLSRYRRLR